MTHVYGRPSKSRASKKRVVVLGAGGFAREVRWLLAEVGAFEFLGYVVSDESRLTPHDSRAEVLGELGWLAEHRSHVDCVFIGIGSPKARRAIGQQLQAECPWIELPAIVHPSVRMDWETCQLAAGVVVCANVVATVNVSFEAFSMANLSCTIGHEARIGEGTVLNPSVNVSGGVRLGNAVLAGTGAQILQYLSVGDGATIGAGAVCTKDVAAGTTVVGIPATSLVER